MREERTEELLDELGLAIENGTVTMIDLHAAETNYIHHTHEPVALVGYALVSPSFARGRFPKLSFIDLVVKRPSMDETEALALAAVGGAAVSPPFWGNGEPFGKHLWDVIARYELEPFFERMPKPFGTGGDHYLMRPRGIDWETWEPQEDVLAKWRSDYRQLETPKQLMVATIMRLYNQDNDRRWLVRVPKGWHAADGIDILRHTGYLQDWAKLYALYPGW